jgi:hypothetical protein
MGAQGEATLDFGAFPGAADAVIGVSSQVGFVAATSLCEAWIFPAQTTHHTADEHRLEEIKVSAVPWVDTAFLIFGHSTGKQRLYGDWNVAWVWNE